MNFVTKIQEQYVNTRKVFSFFDILTTCCVVVLRFTIKKKKDFLEISPKLKQLI